MRTWGILAASWIAACGGSKEGRSEPIVVEQDLDTAQARRDPNDIYSRPRPTPGHGYTPTPARPPTIDVDVYSKPRPDPKPTVKPECIDTNRVVSFDPAKPRACFDGDEDGRADRCVTWQRDGKVASIDGVFDVEDADDDRPEPPVEYRSTDDDDARLSSDGEAVEVCAFDRACIKIMPKLGENGELLVALSDPDLKRGVMLIRDSETSKATLELWDFAAGRLRSRVAMRRLVTDETYDFTAHLGSGVVVALAADPSGHAFGSIFGLDGSFRGELAQGSRTLDIDRTFRQASVLGVVDVRDDNAYVVHLTSLATGGSVGKLRLQRTGMLAVHPLPPHFVAATQWGSDNQLRIDMIDLRTRRHRALSAPGC